MGCGLLLAKYGSIKANSLESGIDLAGYEQAYRDNPQSNRRLG